MGSGSLTSLPNRMVTVDDAAFCDGDPTAHLTASVGGGTAPYTVNWYLSNVGGCAPVGNSIGSCIVGIGQSSCNFTPSPLPAPGTGVTYVAIATDDHGCVSPPECGTLTIRALPMCSIEPVPGVCSTTYNGSASGSCEQGTYLFHWSGPGNFSSNNASITLNGSSAAGQYCLTVTDCHNCVGNPCCFQFTPPSAPSCNLPTPSPDCNTMDNMITASVTGGSGVYTNYDWSLTGSGWMITSVPPYGPTIEYTTGGDGTTGHFSLIVTDSNGCVGQACTRNVTVSCPPQQPQSCRVTGGGNSHSKDYALNPNRGQNYYTHGGQAGAPSAQQPQPFGEWTHTQHNGPAGQWTFHAGTHSAPPGTEVSLIECCDPIACDHAAANGHFKQINFEGVGTFKNVHDADFNAVDHGAGMTFHWFTVHVEDLGEPGSPAQTPGSANCPFLPNAHNCGPADCGCPDFYRITIYKGFVPSPRPTNAHPDIPVNQINKTDKVYEVYGYTEGGNLQIHSEVGTHPPAVIAASLRKIMDRVGPVTGNSSYDKNHDGVINMEDIVIVLNDWFING
jgi:hypothetical protein